jgi:dTDP-4-amino-4,6-dideoxygalactose transaminase
MTDLEASLGITQLAAVEARWKIREQLWQSYDRWLQGLPVTLPCPPEPGTRHGYHLYTPLLNLESIGISRREAVLALRAENIGAGVHFTPIHRLSYYRRRFGFRSADYPRATAVGERTISLPLSACHSEDDIRDTCTALAKIFRYFRPKRSSAHTVGG